MPQDLAQAMAGSVGQLQAERQAQAAGNPLTIRHYLCDHLGTPIGLVDGNGEKAGEITWAASYGAWGDVQEEYNPHRIEQSIRLQGQQIDAETGLHYNRFRYYDPHLGQYITQDPIGLGGGINLYRYVERPTTYIDPLGLTGNAHQRAVKRGEVNRQASIDAQTAGMLEAPSHPLDKVYDVVNPNEKVWKQASPYDYTQYCKKWSKNKLTCQSGDKEPGKDVKTPSDYIPEESMWKSSEIPKGYECDTPVYFKDLQERGTAPTADTDDIMDLANKMRQRRGSRK
ncbi:RHS repeat-associated core domain-containing protein, partial [Acidovorax sp. SUPP950]|uniref:RHS repeat-associated core domain-containing protein n=1 Tax=Acidovorax sp. SUPP950 TaxID=511901 RepID=UPI0024E148DA